MKNAVKIDVDSVDRRQAAFLSYTFNNNLIPAWSIWERSLEERCVDGFSIVALAILDEPAAPVTMLYSMPWAGFEL